MIERQRQMARPPRRTLFHSEDRQQFLVTAAFAGLIALLVIFLVAAVALAFYNENIRSVARVGDVELGPGMVRERAALLRNRIQLEESRLTAARISGEIDALQAQQRSAELDNQLGEVDIVAIEGLIDLVYQTQLAAERGISVGEQEIEQRMADEIAAPERRHVLGIFVEPEQADAQSGPSLAERKQARERAEQALAEVQAGRDWAEVAREYSTDASRDAGGDLGVISELAPHDEAWVEELFELPEGGTTPVIAGRDGIYRIGRVVEVLPSQEEPGARRMLLKNVSDERYREFLGYEIAAEKLREQVVAEVVGTPVEQVRLAQIFIDAAGETGDDLAEEGEIHYSEIVYAPNDDIEGAPDLAADDPAWEAARAEAEATAAELRAIADEAEMAERFAEIARAESDSPVTAEEGGDAGFMTRGLLPTAVGDALFDGQHEPGDLIGPVRSDAGYVLLLFHERREPRQPPDERLEAVKQALAQPGGADFAELAREYSDGENADDGGEIGWFTQGMISDPEIRDAIFDLQAGEVTEALEFGDGHYFFKALERGPRALDADQASEARSHAIGGQPLAWPAAFERWYAPKKDEAEDAGVITRADDIEGDLEPGLDQGDFDEGIGDDSDAEIVDELENGVEEELEDGLEEAPDAP